jgi:hypothetical protein
MRTQSRKTARCGSRKRANDQRRFSGAPVTCYDRVGRSYHSTGTGKPLRRFSYVNRTTDQVDVGSKRHAEQRELFGVSCILRSADYVTGDSPHSTPPRNDNGTANLAYPHSIIARPATSGISWKPIERLDAAPAKPDAARRTPTHGRCLRTCGVVKPGERSQADLEVPIRGQRNAAGIVGYTDAARASDTTRQYTVKAKPSRLQTLQSFRQYALLIGVLRPVSPPLQQFKNRDKT